MEALMKLLTKILTKNLLDLFKGTLICESFLL